MATVLDSSDSEVIFDPRYQTQAAPTNAAEGVTSMGFDTVRTYIAYAGSVTAARLRLWVRDPRTGAFYRGISTDDLGALTPALGNEARDWVIGKGVEFTFTLEAVSPGTSGNTVGVNVAGVQS